MPEMRMTPTYDQLQRTTEEREYLSQSHQASLPRKLSLDLINLKSTLIFVLALLRPQNLSRDNSSDHHRKDEQIHHNQRDNHGGTDDLDRFTVEGSTDGERGRDQGRVGEDERVPRHGEDHSAVSDGGIVGEDGDEEEKQRQPNYLSLVSTRRIRISRALVVCRRTPTTRDSRSPPSP